MGKERKYTKNFEANHEHLRKILRANTSWYVREFFKVSGMKDKHSLLQHLKRFEKDGEVVIAGKTRARKIWTVPEVMGFRSNLVSAIKSIDDNSWAFSLPFIGDLESGSDLSKEPEVTAFAGATPLSMADLAQVKKRVYYELRRLGKVPESGIIIFKFAPPRGEDVEVPPETKSEILERFGDVKKTVDRHVG